MDVPWLRRSLAVMGQPNWARELASDLLAVSLPHRWAHTEGVAVQARSLTPIFAQDAELLEAAAWLHDIGYAPDLVETDFHPLDGARYLRDAVHADGDMCRLVAHHSCAVIEADERGLAAVLLEEFPLPRDDLADALTYCDMTTGPDGSRLSVDRRLAEIRSRYGPHHLVSRSIRRASFPLTIAVNTVQARLVPHSMA